ncbi:MAG: hypothetical protein HKO02_15595 [Hyphomonadaceae bacterium]|nr:hypothetical protein [Hyphomonadaceae bacterium]
MIFRRIKAHIAKEDWFAVFIDFIIVVFGVFMGFQVNNWNEERARAQTEHIYIDRLRDDLLRNHEDATQRLAYYTQVRDHGIKALAALEQPQATLGEDFLIDIYQTSQIIPRVFARDTYDEILSVGANNAISDVAVRNRLANFYGSIQAQLKTLDRTTPYRAEIRRHLPYYAIQAINGACGDIVETGAAGEPTIALPKQCEPGLSELQISQAVDIILERNIRPDLTERISDIDGKLWGLDRILKRVDLLDDYLETIQK